MAVTVVEMSIDSCERGSKQGDAGGRGVCWGVLGGGIRYMVTSRSGRRPSRPISFRPARPPPPPSRPRSRGHSGG